MKRLLPLVFVCVLAGLALGQIANEIRTPVATATPEPITLSPIDNAQLLLKTGKLLDAVTAFKWILEKDPTSAPGYAGLTRAYLKQEQVALAHDVAHKGVEVVANSSATHTALGELYFREGNMADAEKQFIAALQLNASDARAFLGRARIYDSISMYRHGQDSLARAHDLDPNDPDIQRRWLRNLRLADRIAALEKHLAEPNADKEEKERSERYLALLKERQKQPGKRCTLVTKLASTEAPLAALLFDPRRIRGWGLKVNINGHNSSLLLDTGASGILINRRSAERAGITRLVDSKFNGIGDKGPVSGYTAYADSIKVGSLEFQNCLIEVSDRRSVADEDGLIGADVFSSYMVNLDFPARKMRLSPLPPRPDEQPQQATTLKTDAAQSDEDEQGDEGKSKSAATAPTTPKVPSGPKDRYIAPEMKDYTRFFRFGHTILIPTRIGHTSPKLFLVDTGASSTLISPAAAREVTKVNEDSNTTVKGLSGSVKNVYRADKAVLEFSHYRQENQDVLAFDLSGISKSVGTEVSGALGFSVLTMMEVKIDYRDGLIDFVYHPR
jgi:tetratricopeptide (TPR) repeat protein